MSFKEDIKIESYSNDFYSIHLYNGMISLGGLKCSEYKEGTLIRSLMDKYL
jgi:hypothetical protein